MTRFIQAVRMYLVCTTAWRCCSALYTFFEFSKLFLTWSSLYSCNCVMSSLLTFHFVLCMQKKCKCVTLKLCDIWRWHVQDNCWTIDHCNCSHSWSLFALSLPSLSLFAFVNSNLHTFTVKAFLRKWRKVLLSKTRKSLSFCKCSKQSVNRIHTRILPSSIGVGCTKLCFSDLWVLFCWSRYKTFYKTHLETLTLSQGQLKNFLRLRCRLIKTIPQHFVCFGIVMSSKQ